MAKVLWRLDVPDIPLFNPKKADKMMKDEARSFFSRATTYAQDQIQAKAPIGESGRLRGSIKKEWGDFEGSVYTDLIYAGGGRGYADIVEYGRRRAYAPYRPLINWVRLSPKGRKYFSALKKRYKRITPVGAAVILARSMGRKARKGQKFFERGSKISQPYIVQQYRRMHTNIARKM